MIKFSYFALLLCHFVIEYTYMVNNMLRTHITDFITYGGKRCMPRIPTQSNTPQGTSHRGYPPPSQPMTPRQNVQYPRTAPPQRTMPPRQAPQRSVAAPHQYQKPMPPRAASEQLRPINPSQNGKKPNSTVKKAKKNKRKMREERSALGDFLLSFTVSLVLFGIAAAVVCSLLINFFT